MPPKITYWTGVWDPAREALSKEVEILRSALAPGSPVVSFSLGQRSRWRIRDGVITLSGRRSLTLRALAAAIEPRGDVTHAFGTLDGWHFLRYLGRRPLLYTVAIPGPPLEAWLYEKVSAFVAESPALERALRGAGVPARRISRIYPGVDLSRFSPAPAPAMRPFRVLFASTPAEVDQFEARGIPLLVELARRCRDVEIILLWRSWGNVRAARHALARLSPPSNLVVEMRDAIDMPSVYRSVHATICCFADGAGKSIPNSIVEGLACGRPAIVTAACGISEPIAARRAGVIGGRTPDELEEALGRLRSGYMSYAARARETAEELFDVRAMRQKYGRLYEQLATAKRFEDCSARPVPLRRSS